MSYTFGYFQFVAVIFILFVTTLFVQCSGLDIGRQKLKKDLSSSPTAIPCSSLNVSALRVLTFDLFGALMLTESSLYDNIGSLLPSLSSANVKEFVNLWLDAYVSYFGKSFSPSVTHQPFQWVINSSLVQILQSFQLSSTIQENSTTFNALLSTWGNLQPRPDATEVLEKLSKKYQLGLLSNGDKGTLQAALRVFPPSVNVSLILSSDYPANCFKPCSAMYAQALDAVHGDLTQVLHVAGSTFDARGARTFGIYSVAIEDSSESQIDPQPCFLFDNIKQLLSLFDA
jgi:2-haloalkanoic acid dehalogenase type II